MFASVGLYLKLQPAADVPLRGRQHRDRHPHPQRLLLPHLLVRPRVVHRRLPLPPQPGQVHRQDGLHFHGRRNFCREVRFNRLTGQRLDSDNQIMGHCFGMVKVLKYISNFSKKYPNIL